MERTPIPRRRRPVGSRHDLTTTSITAPQDVGAPAHVLPVRGAVADEVVVSIKALEVAIAQDDRIHAGPPAWALIP